MAPHHSGMAAEIDRADAEYVKLPCGRGDDGHCLCTEPHMLQLDGAKATEGTRSERVEERHIAPVHPHTLIVDANGDVQLAQLLAVGELSHCSRGEGDSFTDVNTEPLKGTTGDRLEERQHVCGSRILGLLKLFHVQSELLQLWERI